VPEPRGPGAPGHAKSDCSDTVRFVERRIAAVRSDESRSRRSLRSPGQTGGQRNLGNLLLGSRNRPKSRQVGVENQRNCQGGSRSGSHPPCRRSPPREGVRDGRDVRRGRRGNREVFTVACIVERRCKTRGRSHVANATPTSSPDQAAPRGPPQLASSARAGADADRITGDGDVPGKPVPSVAPSEMDGHTRDRSC